jgi:hypothetical protein
MTYAYNTPEYARHKKALERAREDIVAAERQASNYEPAAVVSAGVMTGALFSAGMAWAASHGRWPAFVYFMVWAVPLTGALNYRWWQARRKVIAARVAIRLLEAE